MGSFLAYWRVRLPCVSKKSFNRAMIRVINDNKRCASLLPLGLNKLLHQMNRNNPIISPDIVRLRDRLQRAGN